MCSVSFFVDETLFCINGLSLSFTAVSTVDGLIRERFAMVVTKPYEAMPVPDCDVVVDVIIFTDPIFLTASNH